MLELYRALPPEGQREVDALIAADIKAHPWLPLIDTGNPNQPTPQQQAYESEADILLYGGAAGGGKTDLICGLALTQHRRSHVFRRENKQVGAIVDRLLSVLKSRQGYRDDIKRFALPDGRLIQLDGMQHLGDEQAYQGHAYDLMAFDELTQFLEAQFRFVITWNRPGPGVPINQRCRVVAASNPPASAEGEWVIRYWAPWLDDQHDNPALPGALRWFVSDEKGEDYEVEGPEDIQVIGGEEVQPKSRTFIPSSVEDNPFLMASGYKATLQQLPEPLRSQMLRGDFTAGRDDDIWQVIPTAWVEAAQARWEEKKPDGPMHAMGVDIARGGDNETVLTARYGDWFAPQIAQPGEATPNGQTAAGLVVAYLRDDATAYVDVIGVGASAYDHLDGLKINVRGTNAANKSFARDRSGKISFVNKRAELWWKMREALDPQYGDNLALPPHRGLKADLCAPRWKMTTRGIQVEEKLEIIKRLGRSPDKGDSAVLALQPKKSRTNTAIDEGNAFAWGRN